MIIGNYLANKEYISANLCEQREVPESACAGSCQLVQALKKDKEQKQEGSLNKVDVVLYLSPIPLTEICHFAIPTDTQQPLILDGESILIGVNSSVFHPPAIQA